MVGMGWDGVGWDWWVHVWLEQLDELNDDLAIQVGLQPAIATPSSADAAPSQAALPEVAPMPSCASIASDALLAQLDSREGGPVDNAAGEAQQGGEQEGRGREGEESPSAQVVGHILEPAHLA